MASQVMLLHRAVTVVLSVRMAALRHKMMDKPMNGRLQNSAKPMAVTCPQKSQTKKI